MTSSKTKTVIAGVTTQLAHLPLGRESRRSQRPVSRESARTVAVFSARPVPAPALLARAGQPQRRQAPRRAWPQALHLASRSVGPRAMQAPPVAAGATAASLVPRARKRADLVRADLLQADTRWTECQAAAAVPVVPSMVPSAALSQPPPDPFRVRRYPAAHRAKAFRKAAAHHRAAAHHMAAARHRASPSSRRRARDRARSD
jgi:hypothetical protein